MAVKNSGIPSVDLPDGFVVKSMKDEQSGKQNRTPRPHRHNFYSILWIKSVRGNHQIDFKDYELNPNTFHFVAPEQVHCLDSNDQSPDGIIYLFNDDFLALNAMDRHYLSKLGIFDGCLTSYPVRKINPGQEMALENLTTQMLLLNTQNHHFKTEKIGALLKLLLLECAEMTSENVNLTENSYPKSPRIFRDFLLAIRDHFKTKHKVSEYAEMLHITPNYLNEVVKTETGKSAKEFILNQITLEAKRFATHSDMSLKEIAYTLGFEDPSNFSKFFKKNAGIDYSNFRDQVKEKLLM